MAKLKKTFKKTKKDKGKSLINKDEEGASGFFSNNENPLFCTECDKELDAFWQTKKSTNPNAVRLNHENCKRIGKFKGDFCSKLFIIDKGTLEGIWMEDDE